MGRAKRTTADVCKEMIDILGVRSAPDAPQCHRGLGPGEPEQQQQVEPAVASVRAARRLPGVSSISPRDPRIR